MGRPRANYARLTVKCIPEGTPPELEHVSALHMAVGTSGSATNSAWARDQVADDEVVVRGDGLGTAAIGPSAVQTRVYCDEPVPG